jgi:hypothetical protein
MEKNIIDTIVKIKNIKDIKNIFWKMFYQNKPLPYNNIGKKIKILILNSPCFGFGDIVFCIKISNFLKEWYNADVTIATTDPKSFKKLGAENVIDLISKNKGTQCRRFRLLSPSKTIPKQDLIFVAPVQSDYSPSLSDVKALIPYSNKYNTIFFSEYNSYEENEEFDFSMGVGEDKYGLLFTKYSKTKRLKELKNPYAFAYIAESIDDAEKCFISFIEMVCAKYYKKHKKLDIVIPDSISYFIDDYEKDILKRIKKYYPNIYIKTKDSEDVISEGEGKNELTFRVDILPVPYKEIQGIMEHSLKDILLTGDQSITDALSCCSDKNIFYQIAPWKEDFGYNLSKQLPNKYLKSTKTSCGTLNAIKYKSNYKDFVKNWDFETLGKPKIDAIILAANFRKENKEFVEDLEDIFDHTKSLEKLKLKIQKRSIICKNIL